MLSVCLCAMLALVAIGGSGLLRPGPAFAADGELSMETPLHGEPDPSAPLIALLPEGSTVTIEGPPVDGFYPVASGDFTGWMRGETIHLQKEQEGSDEAGAAPAEGTGDAAPADAAVDVPPGDETGTAPPADEPAATDAAVEAADSVTPTDSGAPADTVDPTAADMTAADLINGAPAPDQTIAPSEEATLVDPAQENPDVAPAPVDQPVPAPVDETVAAPVDETGAAPSEDPAQAPVDGSAPAPVDAAAPAPEPAPAATPVAVAPAAEATAPAPEEATAPAPEEDAAPAPVAASAPAPEVTPIPYPDAGPSGPASVTVDAAVRAGPGSDFGLIFTVPQGSTVEQTGHAVDGWVTVQFKEVTGWVALNDLGPPIAPAAETPLAEKPAEDVAAFETKTPKPGSGVAYTTADLSLRAGPSANEAPVVSVPAGSRVILTGVMEGGFQRVEFRDQLGWIANEFLATPEDPDPTSGGGKGNQQHYSRREIVRFIYGAADRYDQDRDDMLRVAECESNLDPYAVNPSGSYGLFQFIRSTWKSTPYARDDIFDPEANANAAGWMWAEGRKSEWVCQ
jgi:uncharacterized protein YraI